MTPGVSVAAVEFQVQLSFESLVADPMTCRNKYAAVSELCRRVPEWFCR
jgi:hypothetical protein